MDIYKLIDEVIPPSDYQHRNGFNNIPIIERLTDSEKKILGNALLQKLQSEAEKEIDTLIVETLAYLKHAKSLPLLNLIVWLLLSKNSTKIACLLVAGSTL